MGSHQKSVDDAADYILRQIGRETNLSVSEIIKTYCPKGYRARRFKRLQYLLNTISDEYPEMSECFQVIFALLEFGIGDERLNETYFNDLATHLKTVQGEIFDFEDK